MLERIAVALQIDPPELFSMRKVPSVSLRNLQKAVLQDIERAVSNAIKERLKEAENGDDFQDEATET